MELAGLVNDEGSKNEHCIIVHFVYYKNELDQLHELEEELRRVVEESGTGRYDGHEIAMDDSDGFLFMYGTNAEELFKVVQPILSVTDFTKTAVAWLRFGAQELLRLRLKLNAYKFYNQCYN